MQAIRIHQYGGPEVLCLEQAPKPVCAPHEVLVRVKAAGVNPVDYIIREGGLSHLFTPKFPLILGWDVAGIIEEIGSEVSTWKVGDAIYSRPNTTRDGSYAEYMTIAANEIAYKPATLSFEAAAGVPLTVLTAWIALFDEAKLTAGQSVLIHGGSGGVGIMAIQLAKYCGAYVITTASSRNIDLVTRLGADEVIDYTTSDFVVKSPKVDVILDTIGGETQTRSWQCIKPQGILVSTADVPDPALARQYQAVGKRMTRVAPNAPYLEKVAKLIDEGKIQVVIDSVIPLAEARKAHELSQSGRARGKIILQVAS